MKFNVLIILIFILIPLSSAEVIIVKQEDGFQHIIIGEMINESQTFQLPAIPEFANTLRSFPAVEGYDLTKEKNDVASSGLKLFLTTQVYPIMQTLPSLRESLQSARSPEYASQEETKTVDANVSIDSNMLTISTSTSGFAAVHVGLKSDAIFYIPTNSGAQAIILGYAQSETPASIGYNEKFSGYENFASGGNLTYSKIIIDEKLDATTSDEPLKIAFIQSMIRQPITWMALLFVIASCLASMASAFAIYRKSKPILWKFAFFGLYNILTFPVLWFMSYLKRVDQEYLDNPQPDIQEVKLDQPKRLMIGIPIGLLIIITILWPLSILLELANIYTGVLLQRWFSLLLVPILVFTPLILWGIFKNKKLLFFNLMFTLIFCILSSIFWGIALML